MDEILAAISENMSVSSACDQSHGWDKWMPDHTYNATALRKHYTHIIAKLMVIGFGTMSIPNNNKKKRKWWINCLCSDRCPAEGCKHMCVRLPHAGHEA